MLSKLRQIYSEIKSLPRGVRVVGALLLGGGILALINPTQGMLIAIVLTIFGVGLAFYLITVIARAWSRRKGEGMSSALSKRMAGAAQRSKDGDEAFGQILVQKWRDVEVRLHERGYDYYSLPWYLVIGLSQSGKTTAIRQSDQEFPIGDEPVVEYGGTKNCQWLFANKGIFIDTAGRYLEHYGVDQGGERVEEDRKEWAKFLALLKRYRPRNPINGLIVTIKIPDILEPDPEKRKKTATTIRAALTDVEEQLKIRCPVFILITMCDRLLGFVDFFSGLPGLADRSLLGWARAGSFDRKFDTAELGPGLDQVVETLHNLRLQFLRNESAKAADEGDKLQRLDRLYAFPDEFEQMLAPLREMLKTIFAQDTFHEQHFLRGVYFTSGLQMGQPMVSACRDLLGVEGLAAEADLAPTSKAFFIADFFEDKVFREAGLVRMTKLGGSAISLQSTIAKAVAAVLILAATVWATISAIDTRAIADEPLHALEAAAAANSETALAKLRTLREKLVAFRAKGTLLTGGTIDSAAEETTAAMRALLAKKVVEPAIHAFLDQVSVPKSWNACERTTKVLIALLDLESGHRPSPSPGRLLELVSQSGDGGSRLSDSDLRFAKELLNDEQFGGTWFDALEKDPLFHASIAASSRRKLIDHLKDDILGSEAQPNGFWFAWLKALREVPGSEMAGWLPPAKLKDFWAWRRLAGYDMAIAGCLRNLKGVVVTVTTSSRNVEEWQRAYRSLPVLREGLADHLRTTSKSDAQWKNVGGQLGSYFDDAFEHARSYDELIEPISGIKKAIDQSRERVTSWQRTLANSCVLEVAAPEDSPPAIDATPLSSIREHASDWHTLDKWNTAMTFDPIGSDDEQLRFDGTFWDYFKSGIDKPWTLPTGAAENQRPGLVSLYKALGAKRGQIDRRLRDLTLTRILRNLEDDAKPGHVTPAAARGGVPQKWGHDRDHWFKRFSCTDVVAAVASIWKENALDDGKERCPGLETELRQFIARFARDYESYWTRDCIEDAVTRKRLPAIPEVKSGYGAWERLCELQRTLTGGRKELHERLSALIDSHTAEQLDIKDKLPEQLNESFRGPVSSVDKLWRLYRKVKGKATKASGQLETTTKDLVTGLGAVIHESDDEPLNDPKAKDVLVRAIQEKARILGPLSLDHQRESGGVTDPFALKVASYASVVKECLGQIAGELFRSSWKRLGERSNSVYNKFPMTDESSLVTFVTFKEFLKSEPFEFIRQGVWPVAKLPATTPVWEKLFGIHATKAQRDCFSDLVKFYEFFGLSSAPGAAKVEIYFSNDRAHGVQDEVAVTNWRAEIVNLGGDTAAAQFPTGPGGSSLRVAMDGGAHYTRIVSNDTEDAKAPRYVSVHPFHHKESLQTIGSPLNFLALYYKSPIDDRTPRPKKLPDGVVGHWLKVPLITGVKDPTKGDEDEIKAQLKKQGKASAKELEYFVWVWVGTKPNLPAKLPDLTPLRQAK